MKSQGWKLTHADCGAICSYQISQVGRGLIPVLYLSKHMTPEQLEPLGQHPEAFRSALSLSTKLLSDLGMRFPASARSMDIIDAAARRLDVDITLEGEARLPGHVRRPPRSQSDRCKLPCASLAPANTTQG